MAGCCCCLSVSSKGQSESPGASLSRGPLRTVRLLLLDRSGQARTAAMGMRPSPCHEKLGLFQSTEQPKHGKLKPDWSSRLWGSWELEMQHIIDPLYCAHPCLVSGAGRGGENSSQNLLRVACHSVSGSRRSSNRDQPLSATDSLRGPGHVTSPDLYKIDLPPPTPSPLTGSLR